MHSPSPIVTAKEVKNFKFSGHFDSWQVLWDWYFTSADKTLILLTYHSEIVPLYEINLCRIAIQDI